MEDRRITRKIQIRRTIREVEAESSTGAPLNVDLNMNKRMHRSIRVLASAALQSYGVQM
jgi:hypothetical protein